MKRILPALFAIMLTLMPSALYAVQPDEIMADPAQEARARNLSRELRCMVCQNQSIDDSDAPLARDLRLIVRERLKAGDDDAQVQSYVVGRYGEYVLLRPVFALHTLLLWLTPGLVVALGLFGLWRLARRRPEPVPQGLSPEEQAEIAALTRRD